MLDIKTKMSPMMKVWLYVLFGFGLLYADGAKVVYDLTSGDTQTIQKNLIDSVGAVATHYRKKQKTLDVIVVISGDAYKYFVEDLNASPYASEQEIHKAQAVFSSKLRALHEVHGVRFNMCATGMKARNIERKTLYPYVHADFSKSVYLIEAQNAGYAYMPIH